MQTFTGRQYLMIDIANSFGLDKKKWSERLHWFEQHEAVLETLVKQAKEPAQFFAGVDAWRKTQRHEPTGYMVGLDATASGLQLLSVLSGCQDSAALCNLIDTDGERKDAYSIVHSELCKILGDDVHIEHKDSKQALMTHLYGSKAVPKRVFGEDTPELAAFYQAVDNLLPGANLLNHELLALWNPEAYAHTWTMPDGFEVVVKVMDTEEHQIEFLGKHYVATQKVNRPVESGLSLGANIVHSIDGMIVREMGRRCNFDAVRIDALHAMLTESCVSGCSTVRAKDLALLRILTAYESTGFMSAVIFEHLDEFNAGHLNQSADNAVVALLESMPVKPFPLVCIHDCFKFHANYGNDVRKQYAIILAELADSEILTSIASEITGKHLPVTKISTTLSSKILESEYAIC